MIVDKSLVWITPFFSGDSNALNAFRKTESEFLGRKMNENFGKTTIFVKKKWFLMRERFLFRENDKSDRFGNEFFFNFW